MDHFAKNELFVRDVIHKNLRQLHADLGRCLQTMHISQGKGEIEDVTAYLLEAYRYQDDYATSELRQNIGKLLGKLESAG